MACRLVWFTWFPGPKSPPLSKQRCLGVYMSMYDLTSNVSHCMVCSGGWNDIMLWIIPNYDAILQSRHQYSTFRCTSNLIQLGVQCLKSQFFESENWFNISWSFWTCELIGFSRRHEQHVSFPNKHLEPFTDIPKYVLWIDSYIDR